ncbi:MAG: rhomboid family intramembrane serine protease [Lachnospiraceae bacterium]|nr:rhomboid family intramembrane serine protease [Lachnospiraceae bacterium]
MQEFFQTIIQTIDYNSPVILTFVIVSFFVLVLNGITNGKANRMFFSIYRSSLLSPLTWIRFFTHVLGHSSLTHYIENMMMILLIGPAVEAKYGSCTLIQMIAAAALITGLVHFIFFPNASLRGASGIVYMLISLSSAANFSDGKIPLTFLLVAFLYLGKEIYNALFHHDNISQLTHIIGAVLGIVYLLYFQGILVLPF